MKILNRFGLEEELFDTRYANQLKSSLPSPTDDTLQLVNNVISA